MSHQFYSLPVIYLHRETDDSTIIGFDTSSVPDGTFDFTAGQNITVKLFIEGQEIRRSYSICSCPSEGHLRIGVRAIKDGLFSNYALNHLKTGDQLEVMPPVGGFTTEGKKAANDHYVFFATGSGITPVISMIKERLENDSNALCTLFYSNRNISSMMFRDELDAIKNKNITRLQLIYIFSREQLDADLFYGRMTAEKAELLLRKFVSDIPGCQYFICGPEDQTIALKDLLIKQYNIPSPQVHFELFHTGLIQAAKKEEAVDFTGTAEVTIRLDGKETTFNLAYDKMSILDAGIRNGVDLPYACKGGVCSTCKAHLAEGKVHMDLNYSLEEDEIEDGFILTCQSHPRTGRLFVDFDY